MILLSKSAIDHPVQLIRFITWHSSRASFARFRFDHVDGHLILILVHGTGCGIDTQTDHAADQQIASRHAFKIRRDEANAIFITVFSARHANGVLAFFQFHDGRRCDGFAADRV